MPFNKHFSSSIVILISSTLATKKHYDQVQKESEEQKHYEGFNWTEAVVDFSTCPKEQEIFLRLISSVGDKSLWLFFSFHKCIAIIRAAGSF